MIATRWKLRGKLLLAPLRTHAQRKSVKSLQPALGGITVLLGERFSGSPLVTPDRGGLLFLMR